MPERLPITSAPRDGTRVRLFHEGDLQENEMFPTTGVFEGGRWIMNQGFIIGRGGALLFSTNPTHWTVIEEAVRA